MAPLAPVASSVLLRSGFRSVLLSGLTSPRRSSGAGFFPPITIRRKNRLTGSRVYVQGGIAGIQSSWGGLANRSPTHSLSAHSRKLKFLKESLPKTLYDLARAEQFMPFSIIFATGQRFEIKTRDHISLGPVNRSDVEELKTLIVWGDEGKWKAVYMRAILKIERSQL